MAWQKGPGEGYMAAKSAALAINPKLKCRAVYHNGKRAGYVVEDAAGKTVATSMISRDAWGEAYYKCGGKFPMPRFDT